MKLVKVVNYCCYPQATMERALSEAQEDYKVKLEAALEEERERSRKAIDLALEEERSKGSTHIEELKVHTR